VLEVLPGEEQQALFSALDSEKAAETLVEAEPRAQRQIIASLRKERARAIFSEMTIPQLAGLFTVLPHDHLTQFMDLLTKEQAERVLSILSERETTAGSLVSSEFLSMTKDVRVGEAMEKIRRSGLEAASISYIYVMNGEGRSITGVVDLREVALSPDHLTLGELMTSPVVTAEADDVQEDLAEIFAKYHYRMIPVVDREDRMLGVIHYNDIMKGLTTRVKI